MNIEIHRKLISDTSPYSVYLARTWDRAVTKADSHYIYELKEEDFFIYLIIHLTKHYSAAGLGIRFFIDIYLYIRHYKKAMDWTYIRTELSGLGLREFAENIMGLCSLWFDGAAGNEVYDEMAEYVLSSGIYGTRRHLVLSAVSANSHKKQPAWFAKLRYMLKLFFPPLTVMKVQYPLLEKVPLLLPLCWLLRGVRCLLFKRKHTFRVIKSIGSVSGEDIDRIRSLHSKTGLIKTRND